eukprot:TRINITY_DN5627_c0_g1_i1.p1 TRINITY_DN5627_c0_g1~~TRINITY_DN5627_c0_g1_i1.p1  ORF type:complete len:912 (-),score=279.13 TRINITY_DN5627_c0_g1_i1:37-2463(-)
MQVPPPSVGGDDAEAYYDPSYDSGEYGEGDVGKPDAAPPNSFSLPPPRGEPPAAFTTSLTPPATAAPPQVGPPPQAVAPPPHTAPPPQVAAPPQAAVAPPPAVAPPTMAAPRPNTPPPPAVEPPPPPMPPPPGPPPPMEATPIGPPPPVGPPPTPFHELIGPPPPAIVEEAGADAVAEPEIPIDDPTITSPQAAQLLAGINVIPKVQGKYVNLCLLGSEGSGKVKLVTKMLGMRCTRVPDSNCLCKPLVLEPRYTEGKPLGYAMHLITNIGQEDVFGFTDSCVRAGAGFILMWSVDSRESFEMVKDLRHRILLIKEADNAPLLLVQNNGGNTHEDTWKVTRAEGVNLSEIYKCPLIELSCSKEELESALVKLMQASIDFTSLDFLDKGKSDGSKAKTIEIEIAVVGDTYVGKSAFINRFLTNTFSTSYVTTDSKGVHEKVLHLTEKDKEETILVKLVDSPGCFREQAALNSATPDATRATAQKTVEWLRAQSLLSVHAFIIMFSVTDLESLKYALSVKYAIKEARAEFNKGVAQPVIFVANKMDAVQYAAWDSECAEFVKQCDFLVEAMSCQDPASAAETQRVVINLINQIFSRSFITAPPSKYAKVFAKCGAPAAPPSPAIELAPTGLAGAVPPPSHGNSLGACGSNAATPLSPLTSTAPNTSPAATSSPSPRGDPPLERSSSVGAITHEKEKTFSFHGLFAKKDKAEKERASSTPPTSPATSPPSPTAPPTSPMSPAHHAVGEEKERRRPSLLSRASVLQLSSHFGKDKHKEHKDKDDKHKDKEDKHKEDKHKEDKHKDKEDKHAK